MDGGYFFFSLGNWKQSRPFCNAYFHSQEGNLQEKHLNDDCHVTHTLDPIFWRNKLIKQCKQDYQKMAKIKNNLLLMP